jgi:hypothetical protein
MTQLLEKDAKFKWSPQCEEGFLTLKKLLTTAPVLAQPNIEKSFDVCIVMHLAWVLEEY